MKMNEPVIYYGHTINLRLPQETDILEHNWHNWYNNLDTTRNNSHGVFPISRTEELHIVKSILKEKNSILLAIVERNSNRPLGNVSLQNIDLLNRHCNLAITIGEEAPLTAGLEAYGLMAHHAFMRLNLNRIEDATHEESEKFVKMLSIFGFKEEGRGRKYFFRNGLWSDKIMFSLLVDDFFKIIKKRNGNLLFNTHKELLIAIKECMS